MILSEKIKELKAYIDNWEAEVRHELGLPLSAEHTIGVTVDAALQFDRVPEAEPAIEPGFYTTAHEPTSMVEVLRRPRVPVSLVSYQSFEDGKLVYDQMTATAFVKFYRRVEAPSKII